MPLREGERLRRVAVYNAPPGFAEFHKRMPVVSYTVSKLITRIWTTKILHIADLLIEDPNDNLAKFADARTLLMVPLLNDNELVGFFGIYRQEVRPFTDKQISCSCIVSPPRPSSPSRMRGCSLNCANCSSSRLPRRKCCALSVLRPAN